MSIVFCNCQGLRPKLKELQNYLRENQIDTPALNETFLNPIRPSLFSRSPGPGGGLRGPDGKNQG